MAEESGRGGAAETPELPHQVGLIEVAAVESQIDPPGRGLVMQPRQQTLEADDPSQLLRCQPDLGAKESLYLSGTDAGRPDGSIERYLAARGDERAGNARDGGMDFAAGTEVSREQVAENC